MSTTIVQELYSIQVSVMKNKPISEIESQKQKIRIVSKFDLVDNSVDILIFVEKKYSKADKYWPI